MEQSERYVDKLAKYILIASGLVVSALLCWYFRSILIYILIAVVVSLIAKQMMNLFKRQEGTGLAFGSHIIDHCNRPDNVCHLGHNTYCR